MPTLRMKDFQPGVPVALALKSLDPKEAPDNGYGPAVVFQTTDGSLYLTPAVARQVLDEMTTLAVEPGDPIRIVRKGNRFEVLREVARPAVPVPAPTQMSAPAPQAVPSKLMACFMQAIDAISEAQAYADRRGLKVTFTSEDVRSTAISCWIDACRGGR